MNPSNEIRDYLVSFKKILLICQVDEHVGFGHFGRTASLWQFCVSQVIDSRLVALFCGHDYRQPPALTLAGVNCISCGPDEITLTLLKILDDGMQGLVVIDIPGFSMAGLKGQINTEILLIDDRLSADRSAGANIKQLNPNYLPMKDNGFDFFGPWCLPPEFAWHAAKGLNFSICKLCVSFGGSESGFLAALQLCNSLKERQSNVDEIVVFSPRSFEQSFLSCYQPSIFFPVYAINARLLIISVGRSMWEAIRYRDKPFVVVCLNKQQSDYLHQLTSLKCFHHYDSERFRAYLQEAEFNEITNFYKESDTAIFLVDPEIARQTLAEGNICSNG